MIKRILALSSGNWDNFLQMLDKIYEMSSATYFFPVCSDTSIMAKVLRIFYAEKPKIAAKNSYAVKMWISEIQFKT